MIARNFVGSFFIFCLTSGVIGQAQTTTLPQIKIETAVRVKSIVDLDGNEGRCTAAETSSCLLLKVSGIEPHSLLNTWMMKEKGGVYLTAGDKRLNISTIKTQSNSKYTLIEITVPKDVNEFSLVIGDGAPTVFKVETAVLENVKQADLIKGPSQQHHSRSSDPWEAKILEAAQDDVVHVKKGAGDGWEKAPANSRWLYLRVELKAPKSNLTLSVKQIRLVSDSSEAFLLRGITQRAPKYFTLIEDMTGPGGVIASTWAISEKNGDIIFEQAEANTPAEVFLLFAVPVKATRVSLQVNDGPRVPVQITKSGG